MHVILLQGKQRQVDSQNSLTSQLNLLGELQDGQLLKQDMRSCPLASTYIFTHMHTHLHTRKYVTLRKDKSCAREASIKELIGWKGMKLFTCSHKS